MYLQMFFREMFNGREIDVGIKNTPNVDDTMFSIWVGGVGRPYFWDNYKTMTANDYRDKALAFLQENRDLILRKTK